MKKRKRKRGKNREDAKEHRQENAFKAEGPFTHESLALGRTIANTRTAKPKPISSGRPHVVTITLTVIGLILTVKSHG